MDSMDKITVDRPPPVILTVEQSRLLFKLCPMVLRPYLILTMFAGIRPDKEAMKLRWEHINRESGVVAINFPKVKKQRRLVTLQPIAAAMLREFPLRYGAVSPSRSTVRRWKRKMRGVLGFKKWPADLLRHTAASYLYELIGDEAKVAKSLGNSARILMSHYVVPVSKEACAAFWKI